MRAAIRRLGIERTLKTKPGETKPGETTAGGFTAMAAGAALVALAMLVALPGSAGSEVLPREDLAAALAVVLLGLWMMIARRAVLAQVAGFLTAENGLILAAVGARGMPLVAALAVVTLAVAGALVGGVVFLGGRADPVPR